MNAQVGGINYSALVSSSDERREPGLTTTSTASYVWEKNSPSTRKSQATISSKSGIVRIALRKTEQRRVRRHSVSDPQTDMPTGMNPMAQCAFEILALNVSAIRAI